MQYVRVDPVLIQRVGLDMYVRTVCFIQHFSLDPTAEYFSVGFFILNVVNTPKRVQWKCYNPPSFKDNIKSLDLCNVYVRIVD